MKVIDENPPEEYQCLWDKLLLEGWHKEWKVGGLIIEFYRKVHGLTGNDEIDWEKMHEFVLSINLKRSYSEDERVAGQPVRAFINNRCERLGNCLWSKKHTDQELLNAIDNFKWNNKKIKKQASKRIVERKKRQRDRDKVRRIFVRELDKRNWNFVK